MNEQETTADIIAEMRDEAARADMEQDYSIDDAAEIMREFAWRIEAAHRRELSKNESKNGADFGQLGDAAKLREALTKILNLTNSLDENCAVDPVEIRDIAKAALAAPPRNCDKVKTSWDVLKEWHEGLDTANDVVRLLDWLFAPATEKEGGDK